MTDLKSLIREIHRRSVWQVISIYGAVSWIALQVVQTLVESANLPVWLPSMALVLLVIGFPIVVATAFVQEGAPGLGGGSGVAPERDDGVGQAPEAGNLASGTGSLDRPRSKPSAASALFTWRNAIMGGVGAFALWGVIATFLLSTGRPIGPTALNASERPSVAVLPLESLSVDGDDDDAFARGIHDEIITRLSKLSGLRVTSRTSVMEYAGQTGNMREIARDLGVDMLLEGSIQRTSNQIALNIQLIDGATDEHIWAESYNREYSLENVFTMQREVAERVAAELQMSISPEEAGELSRAPTSNSDAYQTYLQANQFYWSGPRTEEFETAIQLYERAVDLDPDFALAHARLGFSIAQWWQVNGDERTPAIERQARDAVSRALELDSDLPEAYLAQGQVQYALDGNWGLALASLNRASGTGLKGDYYHLLGAAQRRLGDFEGGIASWEEMVRVDPKSSHYTEDLGTTFQSVGRLEEAETQLRRAIELDATNPGPYFFLVDLLPARYGSTEVAWQLVEAAKESTGLELSGLAEGLHYFDRDYERALEITDDDASRANLLLLLGRTEEARVMARQAEQGWQGALEESGRGAFLHTRGARIAVALGNLENAAARAEAALKALPVSADAMGGPDVLYEAAAVFARIGRAERALELLEELMSIPSGYTGRYIALDPSFDPIRGEPRFSAVVAG